jgi:hypothetical protein
MPKNRASIEITRSAYAEVEAAHAEQAHERGKSFWKRARFKGGKRTYPVLHWRDCRRQMPRGGAVETQINDESMAVFCKMLKDEIRVNPDARPALMSLIETLMDHNVPSEHWGTVLFRVWQELTDEPC